MNSNEEPHPLDSSPDDDLGDAGLPDVEMGGEIERSEIASRVHRRLFRAGGIGLIVGFVVTFFGGVAATNAPPNSLAENIGSGVNRLGVVSMLIGAFAMLFAYRIDQIKRIPSAARARLGFGYGLLVAANIVLWFVATSVVALFSLLMGRSSILIGYGGLTIACGVWATMIVWHRNIMRAYAIGVLAALAPALYLGAFGALGAPLTGFSATVALALISGLVSAGYVHLIAWFERTILVDEQEA